MAIKGNTRDKILLESFILYEKPRKKEISLSQVAAGVGISKAAIFKHFKNKEELFNAMEERFLTDVYKQFEDFGDGSSGNKKLDIRKSDDFKNLIVRIVDFFLDNPYYTGYFLNKSGQNHELDSKILKFVISKNMIQGASSLDIRHSVQDCSRAIKVVYLLGSVFYYLAERLYYANGYSAKLSRQEFVQMVQSLILDGLNRPEGVLSEGNRSKIDESCSSQGKAFEENKLFAALVEICSETGTLGVTVEKLGEKLNLSKSSLYSYFNNIDDYVGQMLKEEFENRQDFLNEKLEDAKNLDEMIYILLRGHKNFQAARPYSANVHSMVMQYGIEYVLGEEGRIAKPSGKHFDFFEELGIESQARKYSLIYWVGMLSSFTAVFYSINDLAKEFDYVPEMFDMIEHGVRKNFID